MAISAGGSSLLPNCTNDQPDQLAQLVEEAACHPEGGFLVSMLQERVRLERERERERLEVVLADAGGFNRISGLAVRLRG